MILHMKKLYTPLGHDNYSLCPMFMAMIKYRLNYILYLTFHISYLYFIYWIYFKDTYFCHSMVVAHDLNFPYSLVSFQSIFFFLDNLYELLICVYALIIIEYFNDLVLIYLFNCFIIAIIIIRHFKWIIMPKEYIYTLNLLSQLVVSICS